MTFFQTPWSFTRAASLCKVKLRGENGSKMYFTKRVILIILNQNPLRNIQKRIDGFIQFMKLG